jgi:hypothetical protein
MAGRKNLLELNVHIKSSYLMTGQVPWERQPFSFTTWRPTMPMLTGKLCTLRAPDQIATSMK